MRPLCALCGRPTKPAVMIGNEAIGPKCARAAGLFSSKIAKGSRVRFLKDNTKPVKGPRTLDLFPEIESNT